MRLTQNIKISHKVMILVIVPLLFECGFILALCQLESQSEEELWKESHASAVITCASNIPKLFFDAATQLAAYELTRGETIQQEFVQTMGRIPNELRTLEILLVDDAKEHELFSKVAEPSSELLRVLAGYYNQVATSKGKVVIDASSKTKIQIHFMIGELISSIHSLTTKERRIRQDAPIKQAKSREKLSYYLTGGLAANVVLAILLALFINREMTSRLNVLMENTKKLAKQETLSPVVPGADEISRLDKVFHDMADDLEAAAKHKRDLIAMVSHDLRTPLTSVSAALELVLSGAYGDLEENVEREIGLARINSKRLIDLINDLLDIEQMEAGQLKMFKRERELMPVINEAIDAIKAKSDCKNLDIQVSGLDIKINIDEKRIFQVVLNLLSNAVKFTPENSTIEVDVEDFDDRVEISVKDEGEGVPPEDQERIFNRFEQGKKGAGEESKDTFDRAKSGTGLGLAISKSIVDGHGGTIGVVSQAGKGSKFWFHIPKD